MKPQPTDPTDPTYYGLPVLKKAPWSWTIPGYYYVGGLTGGTAVLGAAATLVDRDAFPDLAVRARWIAMGGAVVSGVFLIYDLGKPERFLNMLRVFRPTSPMSVGSWILTAFSGATSIAIVLPGTLGDAAAIGSGLFGLLLSGYTGVLISNTVVPLWERPRRIVPLLFIASAMASASSFLDFFPWNTREENAIVRYGALGKAADVILCQMLEQRVASVPEVVKPLREGWSGLLWNAGKVLSIASLALSVAPGTSKRKKTMIGILGTAGALCLRFGIHYAGDRSAENPKATFHQHRAGQGGYEATGRHSVTGPQTLTPAGK